MRSTLILPRRSRREIAEEVALGRQVITLMSLAVLLAAGFLVDLGWAGVREPRRRSPLGPRDTVDQRQRHRLASPTAKGGTLR